MQELLHLGMGTIFALGFFSLLAGFIDAVVGGGGLIQLPALLLQLPSSPLPTILGTNKIAALSVSPEVIARQKNLKIVYSPIHGTGVELVPAVLKKFGFENVTVVKEQATPDGNFPTVVYPNPEESEAMSMGLKKAQEIDADILCGTDPDADRVGVGVKNHKGEWIFQEYYRKNNSATMFRFLDEESKEAMLMI